LLMVEGKLQREGEVIHIIVSRCYNVSALLKTLTPSTAEELSPPLSRADERTPVTDPRRKKATELSQIKIWDEGRNFK